MLYVQIVTLLIAVPLGVYSAYRAGKAFDQLSNGFAFLLLSVPVYVAATLDDLVLRGVSISGCRRRVGSRSRTIRPSTSSILRCR